jgi:metal transporter CNNM
MTETKVESITTPFQNVFLISIDTLIDREMIDIIRDKGYSRVPVYLGKNNTFIIGVLLVKTLLGVDIEHPKTLREHCRNADCVIKVPLYVSPKAPLGKILTFF